MLSKTFYAGFICALPVLFFDTALLWRPRGDFTRRGGPEPSTGANLGPPSWSWVTGRSFLRLYFENYYLKTFSSGNWAIKLRRNQRTVPMVQWYSRSCIASHPRPIRAPWELQELKEKSLQGLGDVPRGWSRFDYDGDEKQRADLPCRYFSKHESDPTTEFWYPIPLCSPELVPTPNYDRLLSCRTQRTWLFLSGHKMHGQYIDNHCSSIRDVQGKWAGTLTSDEELHPLAEDSPQLDTPPLSHSEPHLRCELVAISRGYAYEGKYTPGMEEWDLEERPKAGGNGSKYEWYNVLWVEWEEGIAYRKGVGRIEKAMWEAQELEWIDLMLG